MVCIEFVQELGWSLNIIAFKPLEIPPLRTGVRFFGSLWMATELKVVANLVFYLAEHNWLHSSNCESKELVNIFTQAYHCFTTAELFFKVFYFKRSSFLSAVPGHICSCSRMTGRLCHQYTEGFEGQIVNWESVSVEEIFDNLASLACVLKE